MSLVKLKIDPEVDEIMRVGFARSDTALLYKLRRRGIDWRTFSFGRRRGSTKFCSIDFFGEPCKFYFIVGMEKNLIKHLMSMFVLANPAPSISFKGAFNKMLRNNHLIDDKTCVFKN